MDNIRQAVIFVGGYGTRLSPVTSLRPKPLMVIQGAPFIEYLLDQVSVAGISKVLILAGFLGDSFDYLMVKPKYKNLDIRINKTPAEFSTSERLMDAFNDLDPRFLLMYGDNYIPFNLRGYLDSRNQSYNGLASVVCYFNSDGYSKANIRIENDHVSFYDVDRSGVNCDYVDVGYFIFHKDLLIEKEEYTSFGADFFAPAVASKKVIAEKLYHRYYTVTNMSRAKDLKYFLTEKKVVLLDRDGVINKKKPPGEYVLNYDEFEFLPGSVEGITLLTSLGYEICIITNQPCVGHGLISRDQLNVLHSKMSRDLALSGGTIDYLYVCDHSPNKGCFCRKPQPGLLVKAQADLAFNPLTTVFIGDQETDRQAASFLGIKFILKEAGTSLADIVKSEL